MVNTQFWLIIVQYVTVAALFTEVLIVFRRWKNGIHSYLFLACTASFVSNIGYLFELLAGSEEAYITALKLSYMGRVWIVFAFFLFASKICNIRIPKGVIAALLLVHVGIYISVLAVGSSNLYYADYRFVASSDFSKFYHTDGTIHDLFMAMNAVLSFLAFYWVWREYRREKTRSFGRRLLMVLLAYGVQIVFFILQTVNVFSASEYYDLTMPGALFGTVFMLIGILGFDLLGTREIAKDFAIDSISEGIIAVDNNGRVRYYNEPAALIYPQFDAFYSRKRAGERKPVDSEADDGLTPYDIVDSVRKAVREGSTLTAGGRIYSPEENELFYSGESYGKLYTLVDETERYRYMEELEEQRQLAESANEAKSAFLANMSHDIRTPINAVLGMNEMILRECEEPQILDYSEKIGTAGSTLLGLINDILDLSKIEAGKMEILPAEYDLFGALRDICNMIALRAEEKGLDLRTEVDSRLPRKLVGDELRLKQVITNILTNAVKYTEKGTVTFAAGFEERGEGCIALKVSVSDTGAGIREEDLPKLFTEFDRIEEAQHSHIEGTGLGLSIVQKLLSLMGSRLEVESEYGRGSRFYFTVEQQVADAEPIGDFEKSMARVTVERKKYRASFTAPDAEILVVDDTPMNLEVFRNLLKKTLVKIDTASSGDECLALCEKKKYDLIFLDQMMPGKDGIETLHELRDSGNANTETKVICLTANAVSGAREKFLAAGYDDYLAKPVEPAKLEEMLTSELPKDKVRTADGGEPKEANESGIPQFVMEIEELDIEEGERLNGDSEAYMTALKTYAASILAQCDEIENLLAAGNFGDLTGKIHALKSTSKVVGATEIGDFAQALENMGASGNFDKLKSLTGELLSRCRRLGEDLSPLLASGAFPEIPESDLKEALTLVQEFYAVADFESMLGVAEKLKGYRVPESEKERCEKLLRAAADFDYEGMAEAAKP